LKLHEIDALAYGIKAGSKSVILPGRNLRLVATAREFDWDVIKSLVDNWYRLVAFKNFDLTEHHINVIKNCCVPLGSYFVPGSVVDHRSGLVVLNEPKGEYYNGVWGSGEKSRIKKLQAEPHHFIVVTNRNEVRCNLWEEGYTSDLMILRRGQLDTQYTLMFELDKNAVSNVWWPLHPTGKLNRAQTTATLTFVNSALGIIHVLGERLETRGLWMELKKGQLMGLPIPAFEKLRSRKLRRIFRENDLSSATSVSLSKIGNYIDGMAKLEAKLGNYRRAINEALKDPMLKPRATLDQISIELLESLGCRSIPEKMYQLVLDEIEVLRKIMESSSGRAGIIKDKGAEAVKKIADKSQRKLDEWP